LLSLLRGTIHVAGQATAMKTVMAPWYTADWLADNSHIDFHLTSAGQGGYQVLAEVTPRQLAARGNQRVLSVAHSESRDNRSSQYQAVSASGVQAFRVDQARLGLELRPDVSLRRFEITSGRLELPGLTALPSGVVTIDTDETILDLTVATQIDLDQLSRRVLATGSEIRFYGAGAQTFQITGSLNRLRGDRYARSESSSTADSPATGVSPLQIAGGISWERASLFGFDVDATSLQGTLENGVIRTQPIQTRVNGGQLNVMPQLDLDRQRLQLATGSRVSQLQLTPALCRRWVSYAVPVLADSSNVSGTVSARIQSFDFDLQNPERSTASGAMTIHAAEAAPTSELLALLQALDAIRLATKGKSDYSTKSITMQAQEVPITLSQGVISHSDMTFDLSDYRVRSSGQVGMNRSVRLVLDIPLEKMKGSSDYRTVRVPVGGTLDRLQIDTRQLLQGLGAREIENQINQQIDRQLKGLLDKL